MPERRVLETTQSNLAEKLKTDPPKIILIPLVWLGTSKEAQKKADIAMEIEVVQAAQLFHGNFYKSDKDKPLIVAFGASHKNGYLPSSDLIKKHLTTYEIPEEKTLIFQNALTLKGEIARAHWLLKRRETKETSEISGIYVPSVENRVEDIAKEVTKHFKRHKSRPMMAQFFASVPGDDQKTISQDFESIENIKAFKARELVLLEAINSGLLEISWQEKLKNKLSGFLPNSRVRKVEHQRFAARGMKRAARKLRWNKKIAKWLLGKDPKTVLGIYQDEKRKAQLNKIRYDPPI